MYPYVSCSGKLKYASAIRTQQNMPLYGSIYMIENN